MNAWMPFAGVLGLALIAGTTAVLRGPVGKALAQWIRGWSQTDAQWIAARYAKAGGAETERLVAEVDELRRRLADVEERLDFTERMLAQERQSARLAPPLGGR